MTPLFQEQLDGLQEDLQGCQTQKKRNEKTMPFGVNSMRSQVLSCAAQVSELRGKDDKR